MLNRIKNRIHRLEEKSRRLFMGREPTSSASQAPSISSQERTPADPSPAQPQPTVELPRLENPGHGAHIGPTPAISMPTNMQSITLTSPELSEANGPSTHMSIVAPSSLQNTNQENANLTTTSDSQESKLRGTKHTAWSGLTAFLGVLNRSADAFGPLKSAVSGFSQCIEIFE
ncbi:hypothetical protein FRC09_006088, partial [Ceratobasidium sp. 395]